MENKDRKQGPANSPEALRQDIAKLGQAVGRLLDEVRKQREAWSAMQAELVSLKVVVAVHQTWIEGVTKKPPTNRDSN